MHSHLFPPSCIWGRCTEALKNYVTTLQLKCLKYILNVPVRTPTRSVFSSLKVIPFSVMVELTSVTVIFKALQPSYIGNLRLKMNVIRNSLVLKPPCVTTRYGLNSALSKAIDAYNLLPPAIKGAPDYSTFRSRALGHLPIKFYEEL